MKAKAKFKRPSINGRLVVLLSAFIILILMLASPIRDLVAQRARIAALEIQVQQSQEPLPPQPWYKNLYDSWLEADSGEELINEDQTTVIRPNAPK
jgi:hypothetical protein